METMFVTRNRSLFRRLVVVTLISSLHAGALPALLINWNLTTLSRNCQGSGDSQLNEAKDSLNHCALRPP
jgi:hypothetical protein